MNRRRFIRNAAGLMALPSAASAAFLTISGEPKLRISNEEPSEPEDFDFYISPTGSDSNSGTLASPWAITALNTKRATYAGKRVGLLDGTYDTHSMGTYGGGFTPALAVASGSSGSPTIIQAVNPRMAILDDTGSNRSGDAGVMGLVESPIQYIELRDLRFKGARMGTVIFYCTSGRGVGLKIDGCEFYDQVGNIADNTSAIFLQATDDTEITNCYFHDISNSAQTASVSAVLMYGNRRAKIERCTFLGTYGGVHSKYAGGSPRYDEQETHVRLNYFSACTMSCRGFDNKDQTGPPPSDPPYGAYIIENNVFENCREALGNDGPFSAGSPMIVRNNTIYATSSGQKQGFNLHTWQSGCEPSFYNNIWHFGGSASWDEYRALVVSINGSGAAYAGPIDYNCYGPGNLQWITQTGYGYPWLNGGANYTLVTSAANWRSAIGGDQTGRSLFATDALFTMTGSGADRFKLQGGSPCIGAGRVGGVPAGAARNMGAWDGVVTQIGADFS